MLQHILRLENEHYVCAGPSLRLCSCTPSMQRLSDRIMLVRGTDEVVGLYILNYSLLLLWGIASVLVEALFDNKNDMTSFFSAFLALIIGTLCALVHVLMPVRRRRIYSRAANEAVCTPQLYYSNQREIKHETCNSILCMFNPSNKGRVIVVATC